MILISFLIGSDKDVPKYKFNVLLCIDIKKNQEKSRHKHLENWELRFKKFLLMTSNYYIATVFVSEDIYNKFDSN